MGPGAKTVGDLAVHLTGDARLGQDGDGLLEVGEDLLVDLGHRGARVVLGLVVGHGLRNDGNGELVLVSDVGVLVELHEVEVVESPDGERLAAEVERRGVLALGRNRGDDLVGQTKLLVEVVPDEVTERRSLRTVGHILAAGEPVVTAVLGRHVLSPRIHHQHDGGVSEVEMELSAVPVLDGQELDHRRVEREDVGLQLFGILLVDLLLLVFGHRVALGPGVEVVAAGGDSQRPERDCDKLIDCFHNQRLVLTVRT